MNILKTLRLEIPVELDEIIKHYMKSDDNKKDAYYSLFINGIICSSNDKHYILPKISNITKIKEYKFAIPEDVFNAIELVSKKLTIKEHKDITSNELYIKLILIGIENYKEMVEEDFKQGEQI